MKKVLLILVALFSIMLTTEAQRLVRGTITDKSGKPIIGANVVAKGTTMGTVSDEQGSYSLNVPANTTTLVVSYAGYSTQELQLGASNVIDMTLEEGIILDETVVTAMGIKKLKNDLGYSAQKVDGSDVSNGREGSIINSLSAKVAGLNVSRNNNVGGSTNVVLRGYKSLSGDNQALFIVDGVPIDNANTNDVNQKIGRGGYYDYGSAANDINPDDIENVTVLKGAAATALYGSRAANGVILITTKKGQTKDGIGVTVNLGASVGSYDPSTFAKYQNKYGGGYGQYYEDNSGFFLYRDASNGFVGLDPATNPNGSLVVPTAEDASWGARFDPNKQVYQWDAFDPTSSNFGKARPWVAASNSPTSFFETAYGSNNSVVLDKATDFGYFKLGYTRITDKGIIPNSKLNKDIISFGSSFNLTKKLTASANVNYTANRAKGRYGSGYGNSLNPMSSFREWWQVNVDLQDQKAAYDRTKKNVTWNWADPTDLTPIYWDNPYWAINENYQNDGRNRYYGNVRLGYAVTSWLNLSGQVSLDQYNEYQEERIAVGSLDPSRYGRFDRNFREINYDLLGTTKNFKLADNLTFNALLGSNIRKTKINSIDDETNGGLAVPGVYALSNSVNPRNAPVEKATELQVNGIFGAANFNYHNYLNLDLTMRRDQASSLPTENNSYFYPSASLGFNFHNAFMQDNTVLSFGKVRLNYAEVGNTAPPLSVYDTYNVYNYNVIDATTTSSFNGSSLGSNPTTKNNIDLKPERTKSLEGGVELGFLKNRIFLDATVYKMNTVDQILPINVSRATGYNFKYINAGNIENKGVELVLTLRPIAYKNFDWTTRFNWAKNVNKVIDLGGQVQNYLIGAGSFQGGVSVNATVGEAYGILKGNDYTYKDGKRIVGANGLYVLSSTSDKVIGNITPDWTGGWHNAFRYKQVTLSFLIDVKMGGDIFNLDQYYGLATGLYPETAGLNDLGKEVRADLADGGGIILDGVLADGTVNTKRVSAVNFGIYGYRRNPAKAFVYDASFVKLREVNISYELPSSCCKNGIMKGAKIGIYGRNLAILHKNLPYADPEETLSSGNVQGFQVGTYPVTRVIGVNLTVKF